MIIRSVLAAGCAALAFTGLLIPAGVSAAAGPSVRSVSAVAAAPADTPPIDCTIPQLTRGKGGGNLAALAADPVGGSSTLNPTAVLQDLGKSAATRAGGEAGGEVMGWLLDSAFGGGNETEGEILAQVQEQSKQLAALQQSVEALSKQLDNAVQAITAAIDWSNFDGAVSAVNTQAAGEK